MYSGQPGQPARPYNPYPAGNAGGVQMSPMNQPINAGGYNNRSPVQGGMPGYQAPPPAYGQPAGYMNPGGSPMMPPQPNYGPGYGQQTPFGPAGPGLRGGVQQILESLTGFFIKQKAQYMEQLTGWDFPNRYMVFPLGSTGGKQDYEVFYCKETSDWCARMCCGPACRSIDIDIRRGDTDEVVFQLKRECQCTCCCCNRPEMKVYHVENGQNNYLGKVVDPFDCCNNSFNIQDTNDQIKYVAEAGCCQLALCCQCPCESCERVVFDFWSGDKAVQEQPIIKTGQGCMKNAMTSADNFSVPFPQRATWQDKALILALTLMIDFLMFEQKNDSNHRRGGYNSF